MDCCYTFERETERDTETETERQRQRDRQTQTETDRDGQIEREHVLVFFLNTHNNKKTYSKKSCP